MKSILTKPDFDINADFILNNKSKPQDEEHSTRYTIGDLDYEAQDVVDRLLELTVEEYSETKMDKDNVEPPLLFVFGKSVNGRLVYIKVKIKENQRRYVFCVSFHYAREEMSFPYA